MDGDALIGGKQVRYNYFMEARLRETYWASMRTANHRLVPIWGSCFGRQPYIITAGVESEILQRTDESNII